MKLGALGKKWRGQTQWLHWETQVHTRERDEMLACCNQDPVLWDRGAKSLEVGEGGGLQAEEPAVQCPLTSTLQWTMCCPQAVSLLSACPSIRPQGVILPITREVKTQVSEDKVPPAANLSSSTSLA